MASAAAAVKEVLLLVAMCVVLLHSSMGQQPPTPPRAPASHCPYTGQKPPPPTPSPPPPTPSPPPPTPAPAPAPVNCSHNYCFSHCTPICNAISAAGAARCKKELLTNYKRCYGDCTSHVYVCHGKSCLCAIGNCSSCSSNHNATSCCQLCASAVSTDYQRCMISYSDRSVLSCTLNCEGNCYKNCTQGA